MKSHLNTYLSIGLALGVSSLLWAAGSDSGASRNTGSKEGNLSDAKLEVETALQNGAPNGPHYNLNIIGVQKDKSADMTGNNGHRIFVDLAGKTKILLSEGEFNVLDANGTDGSASFQLPNPDPQNDGVTAYSVYARALGKPGGSAQITTCATDPVTGEQFCSVFSTIQIRNKGKSTFTDVSRELLYIFADLNGDGALERYPLFDAALQGYFWDYDNNGLKLLQLRFYAVPSNVGG